MKLISTLALAALFATPAAFARNATFEVANKTGATLTAIYGGPSSSDEWSPNFLSERIGPGESVTITLTDINGCKYDFKYDFSDRESYEEYQIDVCAIDGQSFEIK